MKCSMCHTFGHTALTCRNPTDGEGNLLTTAVQNAARATMHTTEIGTVGTTRIAGQ